MPAKDQGCSIEGAEMSTFQAHLINFLKYSDFNHLVDWKPESKGQSPDYFICALIYLQDLNRVIQNIKNEF